MTNRNYVRGRAFEYEVVKLFKDKGWLTIRASGSHGVADVVAIKDSICLLIQCKYGANIGLQEKKKMLAFDKSLNNNIAILLVAHRKPRTKAKFYKIEYLTKKLIEVDIKEWL